MAMKGWGEKLDDFLRFTRRNVLTHAGKISHKLMEQKAHQEFDKFDENRPLEPIEYRATSTNSLSKRFRNRLEKK